MTEPAAAHTATLKARIREFWRWFSADRQELSRAVGSKAFEEMTDGIRARLGVLFPAMSWTFGPGPEGRGHSFTLSPEGEPHKRLVARSWLEQAPELEGWTFYGARPRGDVGRFTLDVAGSAFAAIEMWVSPAENAAEQKVDLTIWHPLFERIDEHLRWTVSFLWLDEALGEEDTAAWVGDIQFGADRLADAMPLSELPEYIDGLRASRPAWDKPPADRVWTGYQRREPRPGEARTDILTGTTCLPQVAFHYPLDAHPLPGFGLDFSFLKFPVTWLAGSEKVGRRAGIEDSLTRILEAACAGRVTGGAMGMEHAYIDLALFDGLTSVELIRHALRETGLPAGAELCSFVRKGPPRVAM